MTGTSERSIWKHSLGFEVNMVFKGQQWHCQCEALGIETVVQHQASKDLELTLADWIGDHLKLKKASQITSPSQKKTIWDILSEVIKGDGLVIAPRGEKMIFQRGACSVSLFHDRDGRLRLVARNGSTTTSPPIAHNPFSAPAGEWHLVKDARKVYEGWVRGARAMKDRRPLWHHRPAVDALMKKHNVSRDEAADLWQERGS